MECVILFRYETGKVDFMRDEAGDGIAVFPHIDDAINEVASRAILDAIPYQIVELDEL